MSVNIESLSSKELAALITRANQRKKVLAKRKPSSQVKAAIAKVLRDSGWSMDELFGRPGITASPAARQAAPKARKSIKGRTLGKVAPKYRNPENSSETWAGRGKQPKWLAAETGKGRSLDEFLIR